MPTPPRKTQPVQPAGTSTVDFHRGEVLIGLAHTYNTLMLTILEGVQNAIDADAGRILVGIDLRRRGVYMTDNGLGVDRERFELGLASVGRSEKSADKLGRFGRGLIAPLDKCQSFTLTSRPLMSTKALQWTFTAAEIRKQHHELLIPRTELPALPRLPAWLAPLASGEFDATWRTQVVLKGITQDRFISLVDLDELESQLRQKFGRVMLQKSVSVRLVLNDEKDHLQYRDINPVAYTGEALPPITYVDAIAGEVVFELYRASKRGGVRRGEVVVMEMDGGTPITMKEFIRQSRGGEWREILESVFTALGSGYFEGVIMCKNIQLHPERTKFEYNEALHALYLVMSKWFEDHGQSLVSDDQETTREERYQLLGVQSQQRIRDTLLRPEYSRLWEGLTSVVTMGRLGSGHVDPAHGKPGSFEENPSIRSGQGGAGTGRTKGTGGNASAGERQRDQRDRSGDLPTGASGPRGQRRQLVRGDSQGLWFEYSWMEGNSRLWEFDFTRGILTFNVRHPIWVQLDETNGRRTKRNDLWIMQLQEWLALEVLVLLMSFRTHEELEEYRRLLDTKIRPFVELHIMARRR